METRAEPYPSSKDFQKEVLPLLYYPQREREELGIPQAPAESAEGGLRTLHAPLIPPTSPGSKR